MIPSRVRQFARDDRGSSLVFIGLGFMAFFAAGTLAIDVGMITMARSQAQNSADAGAIAGAVALVANSYTDRTATGPAVRSAIDTALKNQVVGAPVSVQPGDVTFPLSPTGQDNRVRVTVYRTAARLNPVDTLIGRFYLVPTADVSATATAEASPANAMTCVKPFMIPDKWIERSTPANGRYDYGVDTYIGANDPGYTGYSYANDVGTPLVLRAGTGSNINPSFYFSWKMPGDTGADFYEENIATCNQSIITWGSQIIQEPGNMVGPTISGIEELIARDPSATWDGSCNCVRNSSYSGQSPRVFPIPLYDPEYYANGQAHGRFADFRVANFLGFFVDRVVGNQIHGIITNITGLIDPNAPSAPANAFPMAIRLVE